jgi:putative SOS response-associated peptidase YedK
MCGRMNVIDSPLTQWVCDYLGIEFTTQTNTDLRPTQPVDTIAAAGPAPAQLRTNWGIKPAWSKSLLINAQAETVATKPTFRKSFSAKRCLIPVTGWYEWRAEGGPKKQRYSFTHVDGIPFLMAGIWFGDPAEAQLVTLTTNPAAHCAEIHNRMPLLVDPDCVALWLSAPAEELGALLGVNREDHIEIRRG